MTRTATVKKVKGGWRCYVYGVSRDNRDPGRKGISRTFKTKVAALKAAKNQRETASRKGMRKADRPYGNR